MIKLRKGSAPLLIACLFSIIGAIIPSVAKAETLTATENDRTFYFSYQEAHQFTARAYAWQNSQIDSYLWLYNNDTNQILTQNDDYFGLDSYISYNLEPNVTYRLVAGVCCGDPTRWYRTSYQISVDGSPIQPAVASTTTSTSTTSTSTTSTSTTTTTTVPLPSNSNWSMVQENGTLELQAPSGFVFSDVLFASYGTPNGNYGHWSYGQCHSQNSQAIVESYIIGNNFASIPVNNGIFGDPCGGVIKRLAVTALYAPAPTTTTTSTTSTTSTTTTSTSTTTTTVVRTTVPTTTTTLVQTTTTLPLIPALTTTTTSSTTSTTSTIPPTTTTTTIPIVEQKMESDQAVSIASNPEAIKELTKDEATKVFESIDISSISEEEKTQIIDAIQDAPTEVKQAFEAEINIYADGFDTYVPTGSTVPVKARRTLLAIAGASSSIMVAPVGGSSGPGGSGGGLNGGGGGSGNDGFKNDEDDEDEDEEAPEIEGPEGGDDEEVYTKNSIYKYSEDGMRKFSIWNFIKKISSETAALAFTISSTVIVFATLSGDTRKITLIATTCAFLVHYTSVMLKNDE